MAQNSTKTDLAQTRFRNGRTRLRLDGRRDHQECRCGDATRATGGNGHHHPPSTSLRESACVQPREVLKRIQEGNARFWMGLAERPEMSAMERRALIMQQTPKVAILGCSDSRVPIEIVFDQGLGDVFAIRVSTSTAVLAVGDERAGGGQRLRA